MDGYNLCSSSRYILLLQQQHLIELIRERNIEGALDFAQLHLAERGEENPEILSELERTLALLAFDDPEASPFGDLLHPSQRQKVQKENAKTLDENYWPEKAKSFSGMGIGEIFYTCLLTCKGRWWFMISAD